ncbi:MAG: hypothetical protein IS860_04120 [Nitrosopumilus sp.]|nr:hypothetical protein [Nitrosopumilus sp.]
MNSIFCCKDKNPKIFKVKFDSGKLGKDDTWNLCVDCNSKSEFRDHRISTEKICLIDENDAE